MVTQYGLRAKLFGGCVDKSQRVRVNVIRDRRMRVGVHGMGSAHINIEAGIKCRSVTSVIDRVTYINEGAKEVGVQ